jgi:hypothetical protein
MKTRRRESGLGSVVRGAMSVYSFPAKWMCCFPSSAASRWGFFGFSRKPSMPLSQLFEPMTTAGRRRKAGNSLSTLSSILDGGRCFMETAGGALTGSRILLRGVKSCFLTLPTLRRVRKVSALRLRGRLSSSRGSPRPSTVSRSIVCLMRASIAATCFVSSGVTSVYAVPVSPARPVRPMR